MNPDNGDSTDTIGIINNELEKTQRILSDSVSVLISRGERLEEMESKSTLMSEESRGLNKNVRKNFGSSIFAKILNIVIRISTCNYLCCDMYDMWKDME